MSWKRKHDTVTEEVEEERYFLNPESVSRHLFCSICQEVFVDPQRAPCGHSFCKKCILPWLKNSRTCPEDRKHLTATQLHHDFILENIIGDQMVACPFRRSGCEFIGQLERLKNHKRNCDFNPQNLPEFLKSKDIPKNDGDSVLMNSNLDVVPSPGKPSLMMRLFRSGESQKQLLVSMFDDNKKTS